MLKIIPSTQLEQWDEIVRSFSNWDVYYLAEYCRALEEHEGGMSFLVYFQEGDQRLCYPVMQKDISDDSLFQGILPSGQWYDWETPYGYGGPLSEQHCLNQQIQRQFQQELTQYCYANGIVSQFVRFHPLLQNQEVLSLVMEHKRLKNTVYMDTTTEEAILGNMDSKARNIVRKAVKNGVSVRIDRGEHLKEFVEIYHETMDRDHATPYYYFPGRYYQLLCQGLGENLFFFYGMLEEQIIAAAIFFYSNGVMHYHLSGGKAQYRKYAANTLILYEAARWGAAHGIRQLHLGGGATSEDDSLFSFKKQFNKHGQVPFYIGRMIFDPEAYDFLLKLREEKNPEFKRQNGFYIQYRKPED